MSVKIKICGLTRERDVRFVAACGVDYVGFVLYERSPRYVCPDRLRALSRLLPASIRRVGVVVNADVGFVAEAIRLGGLQIIQFHGDESREVIRSCSVEAWQAVGLRSPADIDRAAASPAALVLADAVSRSARGGTGTVCDWRLATALARRRDLVLAGGLHPGNVAEAIEAVKPFAVDVSSGVESEAGRKDPAKVRAFVEAVRGEGVPEPG